MSERFSRMFTALGQSAQPFAMQAKRQEFLSDQADLDRAHREAMERNRQKFQTSERQAAQQFASDEAATQREHDEARWYQDRGAEVADAELAREQQLEDQGRAEEFTRERWAQEDKQKLEDSYLRTKIDLEDRIQEFTLAREEARAKMGDPQLIAQYDAAIKQYKDQLSVESQMFAHRMNAAGDPRFSTGGGKGGEGKETETREVETRGQEGESGSEQRTEKPEPAAQEADEPGITESIEKPRRRRHGGRKPRGLAQKVGRREVGLAEGAMPGTRKSERGRSRLVTTIKPGGPTGDVSEAADRVWERFKQDVQSGVESLVPDKRTPITRPSEAERLTWE